jgi:hypothetical protein
LSLSVLEESIDRLLEKLEEAEMKLSFIQSNIYFCLDCFRILEEGEWVKHPDKHTIIFTSIDHDGIYEWKRCLNWVKQKIREVSRG